MLMAVIFLSYWTSKETTTAHKTVNNKITINSNITCEPHTFIDFDCNSCFCNKTGHIDPKWCTYDDCEAKRIIQEAHETNNQVPEIITESCLPGSITGVECNFCICPDSGSTKDSVCTKNKCSVLEKAFTNDKFTCEPSVYYEVDCNVCLCPRDGLKNIAKCTKNHCERNFLRSDVCIAGELFSDECNVCVCPPNGNKSEKACTNYTCSETVPWKRIVQLSESLLGNQVAEDATRNLEFCFPGEEFAVGCKLCVCPDMGLRVYATCSPLVCEEGSTKRRTNEQNLNQTLWKIKQSRRSDCHSKHNRCQHAHEGQKPDVKEDKPVNSDEEDCMVYNVTHSGERKECTPGSMYIVKCQQCICPYMGSIAKFCRPLPKGQFCEQAFPFYNFLPAGRKRINTKVSVKHVHTKRHCDRPGKVMDECFICDCEDQGIIIEEHCFRSDDDKCEGARPTFLRNYTLV